MLFNGMRSAHIRSSWEPAHYTAELGEVMLGKMVIKAACTIPPTE